MVNYINRGEKFYMHFAQRLEKLRLEKGYTQEELARLINVTQPTYWKYEHGGCLPHKNTQIQLAKVLNITIEELMNDEEEVLCQK